MHISEIVANLAARGRGFARSGDHPIPGPTGPTPPTCEHCLGAGWVRVEHPSGMATIAPCGCLSDERARRNYDRAARASRLSSDLARCTLGSFDGNLQPEALTAAKRLASHRAHLLTLVGHPGTGKSHLAAALVGELVKGGVGAIYWVVPDLLDHLRGGFNDTSQPGDRFLDRLEPVARAGFLALDDLGAENATTWAGETLFRIVDTRWRESLPTVITTNTQVDELHPRLASRLQDKQRARVVVMRDGDYRRSPARIPARGT